MRVGVGRKLLVDIALCLIISRNNQDVKMCGCASLSDGLLYLVNTGAL